MVITRVGERGVNIRRTAASRLAIARAVLLNPRIYPMKPPALDSESEALVQEALERLTQNRTVLSFPPMQTTLTVF